MHTNRITVANDVDRYLATEHTVWLSEVPAAGAEAELVGLEEEQRFATEREGADPATYPGIYGVFPMTLVVPGRRCRARGPPGWACIATTAARAWLTAMLRHHLEPVLKQAGTHVPVRHASEPAIYRRYGYGLASLELEVTLSRGATLTAPG